MTEEARRCLMAIINMGGDGSEIHAIPDREWFGKAFREGFDELVAAGFIEQKTYWLATDAGREAYPVAPATLNSEAQ